MSNNPRVSILMTLFNRASTVQESIQSVLNSTFENWELIILDDCSSDNSFDLAKEFSLIDSRIKVYRNKKNLGDYPNRNEIVKYANGYYLKYLDSDDMLYPYGLEMILEYMDSNPKADWGLTDINQDDFKIFPYLVSGLEIYKTHYNIVGNIFTKAPSSLIIKKTFFEKTGGFINFKGISDFEFFYRISINSNLLIMPYGYLWCRGETAGSQSSIHFRNRPLHALYEVVEGHYLEKVQSDIKFKIHKRRNRKRRIKNLVKIFLNGPSVLTEYLSLKSQLMEEIKSKSLK